MTYTSAATWPDAAISGTTLTLDTTRRPEKPGMYTWVDPQSNAGFSYWYSVRSYAKGHSTWTNNDATKTFADLPARVQTHVKRGLEKLRARLGWRPRLTLEEGLRDTYRWFGEHGTRWITERRHA